MNSSAPDAGKQDSQKTQNLSRFHPRSQERSDEDQPQTSGSGSKSKEGWVHTPSGLRPVRSSFRSTTTPVASIPKMEIPDPAAPAAAPAAEPTAEPAPDGMLPIPHPSTRIPHWLLKEMSLATKGAILLGVLICVVFAFRLGEARGRKTALREIKPAPTPAPALTFPEEQLPELDTALQLLRNGKNLDALNALDKLATAHPDAPSVHYAKALAALQSGYPREADRMADTSISKGFRVSDSWALKAAIAAMSSKGPSPEQESLLKKAIAADPMNPNPFIELASLLRYRNQNDEAAKLLEAATARLNPADNQTVLETTRAILAIETGGELLPPAAPLGIPSKDFPNAFSEMKRGHFENAAAILRFCRTMTGADLFYYLVNDPSLRKFSSRPELAEFY